MNTPHAQTIAQSVPRCPRYWPATRELVPPDGAIGAALGADLEGRKGRGERLLSAKMGLETRCARADGPKRSVGSRLRNPMRQSVGKWKDAADRAVCGTPGGH